MPNGIKSKKNPSSVKAWGVGLIIVVKVSGVELIR